MLWDPSDPNYKNVNNRRDVLFANGESLGGGRVDELF